MVSENEFVAEIKEIPLNKDGYNTCLQLLKNLAEENYTSAKLIIACKAEDLIKSNKINKERFAEIKQVQSLPDKVIIDFLNCKGTLSGSNLLKKVKY